MIAARTPTRSIRSPTSTHSPSPIPKSSKLSAGAIGGIAAGGGIVLNALLVRLFCCVRRNKKERQQPVYRSSYPQAPAILHDSYVPQYQPTYQLPAPVPVELSSANVHNPKTMQVHEYIQHSPFQVSPSHSPHLSFYVVTEFSKGPAYESRLSSAPTYSSGRRTSRKPVFSKPDILFIMTM